MKTVPLLILGLGFIACAAIWTLPQNQEPRAKGRGEVAMSASHAVSGSEVNGLVIAFPASDGEIQVSSGLEEATSVALSRSERDALLHRLPAFDQPPLAKPFHQRLTTRPAPRPGETVAEPFPAQVQDGSRPDDAADFGSLRILRYGPVGAQDTAAAISVTFSLPMVPLSGHSDLEDLVLPVQMEPNIEGHWRWVGTQTLVFDRKDRLPMATEYTLTIPAGTRSQNSAELEETLSWRFQTAAAKAISIVPSPRESLPLNPIFVVRFNQSIRRAQMLASIRMTLHGKPAQFRLVDKAEMVQHLKTTLEKRPENDWNRRHLDQKSLEKQIENHLLGSDGQPNRWLAFKAKAPFKPDREVMIRISSGAPSREGPLRSTEPIEYRFQTYKPFALVRTSWDRRSPRPNESLSLTFNNRLDKQGFDPKWVKVNPVVPDLVVEVHYQSITLRGSFQAKTKYQITISSALKDDFGQTLKKPLVRHCTFAELNPSLQWQMGFTHLFDPFQVPEIKWTNANYPSVKVVVHRVRPEHWGAYQSISAGARERLEIKDFPGERVYEEDWTLVEAALLVEQKQALDLSEFMHEGFGHFIVSVQVNETSSNKKVPHFYHNKLLSWVQRTDIGLVVFSDSDQWHIWANDLKNGRPLANTQIELRFSKDNRLLKQGKTDVNGLLSIALPQKPNHSSLMVMARRGSDIALFPDNRPGSRGGYHWPFQMGSHTATYITDGRGLYRPGEKVNIKGWIRLLNPLRASHPEIANMANLHYRVLDSRGNKFADGAVVVTPIGGIDFQFEIPDDVNLGYAEIYLNDPDANRHTNKQPAYPQATHRFQIQEFRRPEYQVTVETPAGPHLIGDTVHARVEAKYYAGGGLGEAPVRWRIQTQPTQYAPPGWPSFAFGQWQPWWRPIGYEDQTSSYTQTGSTDMGGAHHLPLKMEKAAKPVAYLCSLNVAVRDVNAQEWQASSSFLVHAGAHYVGLRTGRYFVEKGQPFAVEAMVVDLDGQVKVGQTIDVEVHRLVWQSNGEQKEVTVFQKTITSGKEPVAFRFPTPKGGNYSIKAVVRDGKGRANLSKMTRWVTGGASQPDQSDGLQALNLIPNQEIYQPGDVAEILVQAPFQPAEGMFLVQQYHVETVVPLRFDGQTATIRVPITDDHIPNIKIQVELVGHRPSRDASGLPSADLPRQPAHASGTLKLRVPPRKRELKVQVLPEKPAVQPGAKLDIQVMVSDAQGNGMADADVALMVIDEAILALSGFRLGDPLEIFYPEVFGQLEVHRLRDLLQSLRGIGEFSALEGDSASFSSMDFEVKRLHRSNVVGSLELDGSGGGGEPINIRLDFNPVAAFLPSLTTDGSGQVTATIQLPDNLTRYRVMALAAVGSGYFGTGASNLTARLPLMLRPSPPRFLNYGDQFELPFVVQNQTEDRLSVSLVARTQNLALRSLGGRRFEIGPGERVEIRLPAAAESAGTARVQAAVFSDDAYDAAEVAWPVWTPATSEAFATYGVIDEGSIAQKVMPPADVFAEFGGLEITTSSTALQGLTDAFVYLIDYPFACSEQLSSRILAAAALRDVLAAFKGDVDPDRLHRVIKADLARLAAMQNSDGGFGFWRRNEKSWPFLTVHVAHALVRAKRKGFAIPDNTLQGALRYLASIEKRYEQRWSEPIKFSLSAYALHVRRLAGDSTQAKAKKIMAGNQLEKVPMEGLGWLLPSLPENDRQRVLRFIDNRISETAATAQITSHYQDKGYLVLHAQRRDDAVLLESLIQVAPESDVIVKLVRGLMASRVQGRWRSTQENVFVLLAMDRYFQTYEKQTPEFLAQIWLGNQFAGEQIYSGRETLRRELKVPMTWLQNQGPTELLLTKEGEGRLYYRLGMRYAPKNLQLEPAGHGFFVSRSYSAVDDPDDVTVSEDGRILVKRGARVKVSVSMVAPARRYHVALIDPLPAGFEPMNPSISGNQPPKGTSRRPWEWTWFGHQNLRDDRAEAFAVQVYPGGYEYSYTARATTPGVFIVPPPKAEEMYHPETFGRGASAIVEVH